MTEISRDLFLAILSMDAYNRGYDRGLEVDGDSLGIATISTDSERELRDPDAPQGTATQAQDVGFYAIAYDLSGEKIISYRGTDNPDALGSENGASDVWNGWITGIGLQGSQSQLAFDFFHAVTDANALQREAGNVILTGHSLGGGLAGLVAALSGDEAVIFDNMPYGAAATVLAGSGTLPNGENISGYHVAGEVLQFVRPLEPAAALLVLGAGGGIVAENAAAILAQQNQTSLASHGGLRDPFNQLHYQGLVPFLMFGQEAGHTAWTSIAGDLLDALFENKIAEANGFAALGGTAEAAKKQFSAIAYSIIDENVRPFGDVAIRSLFNDADDLGGLVSQGASNTLSQVSDALTQAIVQFSGLMAKNKLLRDSHPDLENGILKVSSPGQSGYAGIDRILTVNFDRNYWGAGSGEDGTDASFNGEIVGLQSILDGLFASPFVQNAALTSFQMQTLMEHLWGPVTMPGGQTARFNAVHLALDEGAQQVRLPDLTDENGAPIPQPDKTAIFISGDGNDQIAGSNGNDFVSGGAGDDTLLGGAGKDLLAGGSGSDTFISLPGMANSRSPDGGDGDDVYIGGQERLAPWVEWILTQLGHGETDTVKYLSGEQSPELFQVDGSGATTPIEREASRSGVIVEQLKNTDYALPGGYGVEIVVRDMETGRTSGTDTLVSIERVELSDNPDILRIQTNSLETEIIVEMGKSRRLASELQSGDTLDDDAFIHNVDVADYSAVDHGLVFFNGLTTERAQGLLTGGVSQLGGIEAEYGLITGLGDVDNLRVHGADKIVLTNFDDVLVSASYGSVIDLGNGQDKVWLQPGLLVQSFDANDRLTLFGAINLYGGSKWKGSDSAYTFGLYGEMYGVNQDGDLLVVNPWMIPQDGRDPHMYIEGWQQHVKGEELGIGSGPGDIVLAELEISSHLLLAERPKMANEVGLWGLVELQLRALTGSGHFGPETSDPLVLDLDGDGLDLVWRDGSSPRFDVDFDLYSERTAWAGAGDGMLARDINGNGTIDDGSELFGYGNTYGFSILASLDGNADGKVDAADNGLADFNGDGAIDANDTFSSLLVWQDYNGNLISETSELSSVEQLGIVSFNLPTPGNGAIEIGANGEAVIIDTINGNHLVGTSTFTRSDGTTSTVGEVLLNIDDMNTRYDGDPIALTPEVAALPDLKGFGTLTDLRKAISYMSDPADANQILLMQDRAATLSSLLSGFNSNNLEVLAAAIRPIAQIWGNAAPVRDGNGAIVTGLEALTDLLVVKSNGNIIDYVWGGTQSTETDTDGSTITHISLEFASGARIVYTHDSDDASPATIDDWRDLYDGLFGVGSGYILDAASTPSNLFGLDGGEITTVGGAPSLTRNATTGNLQLAPGTEVDWVKGEDLAFFERYIGGDLSVFFQRPAQQTRPIATLVETLTRIEESYRELAIRVAVQAGPLSQYFTDLRYDVLADSFVAVDSDRELGGVFEKLIAAAEGQPDPVAWLHEWKPMLDYVIGNFQRSAAFLENTNPFLLQNLVDGFETSGTALDFIQVATALGLPGDIVIDGVGELNGTNDLDLFYIDGDETTLVGMGGPDAYIVGRTIGHVLINDTVVFDSGVGNQVRFSHHLAMDFDVSRNGEDLVLTVIATGETLTVKGQFAGEWPGGMVSSARPLSGIDQIVFANGTTWSDADITREAATVDPGSTTVTGTNDTDYMWGGTGNDLLEGGADYDIYRFDLGDGHDVIYDFEDNPFRVMADSIYFGVGITARDLAFSRDGNSSDYTISYGDLGDRVVVRNANHKIYPLVFPEFFTSSIEFIVFTDGSSITERQIMDHLIASQSTVGNDSIYGFNADDTIALGRGDDFAQGGNGNDTYIFGAGDGHDRIRDATENVIAGMDDTLVFTSPFDLDDVQFLRDQDSADMTIVLPEGDTLTLLGQYGGIYPGVASVLNLDLIETFKYIDLSRVARTFSEKDLRELMLARASTDGDDAIYGFPTYDVITGGLGNDLLSGGNGNDVYRYNLGDGQDIVRDNMTNVLSGEFDIIELGAGIDFHDVEIARDPNGDINDLTLIFADGGSIILDNQVWYTTINYRPNEIEEIRFADGTVWTSSQLNLLYLERAITAGNDTIFGFFSNDTLYGGAGDDELSGLDGDDTYLFGYGDGHDTIRESTPVALYSDFDTVRFGAGIGVTDVIFTVGAAHEDVIATLVATGETLTIIGQNSLWNWWTPYDVEQFVFEDGTILTKADILPDLIALQVTSGDDVVLGFNFNDTLYGGAGNDTLKGDGGDDTYLFGYGSGNDIVIDNASNIWASTDNDRIVFDADISLTDVTFLATGSKRQGLIITLTQSGETLTLPNLGDVEYFVFGGGTTLTRADVRQLLIDQQVSNGDDVIAGTSGNDTIAGGAGNDRVTGLDGHDTYIYNRGDGEDILDETQGSQYNSGIDQLLLRGITSADVGFERAGDDIILIIAESSPGAGDAGRITLLGTGSYGAERGIEKIVFDDGTVWDRAIIIARSLSEGATDGDDTLTGTNGSETFQGGRGNDTLSGGTGDDTYIYNRGDGDDVVDEANGHFTFGGNDTLVLHGIAPSAISFELNIDRDIVLIVAESSEGSGDGGRITLAGTADSTYQRGIEKVLFDDGTVWSKTDLKTHYFNDLSTDGDDTIVGFNSADTIEGGRGNDTLSGGTGDDTYIYNRGDGDDVVDEATAYYIDGGSDKLVLHGISPTSVSFDIANPTRDIVLVIAESVTGAGDGGRITLAGTADSSWDRGIETVVFDDGTVWSKIDLKTGYFNGLSTNGDDIIVGFNSPDTFEAGHGNDTLTGGTGNDTYIYNRGDGNDVINEATGNYIDGGSDKLVLRGVSPASVSFEVTETTHDIVLVIGESSLGAGDGGRITLLGSADPSWGRGVETVVFDDGTIWTNADLKARYVAGAGTAGDDTIYGFSAGETFHALAGDDTVSGGGGDDTYIYNRGDGNDIYDDSSGLDQAVLADIASTEVVIYASGSSDLVIKILESTEGAGDAGSILIRNGRSSGLDQVVFSDVTWARSDLVAAISYYQGTEGNDTITGSVAADDIRGGHGDDLLVGQAGNDSYTYRSGDGNDIINEVVGGADVDTLVFQGLNLVDVQFERPLSDLTRLVIRINATGETLTLNNQFNQAGGVEQIIFDDGTVLGGSDWSLDGVLAGMATILGTDSAETISGTSGNDSFKGMAGDDYFNSGAGSDTYIYASGDGNDYINDESGSTADVDTLRLTDLNVSDVEVSRVGVNLKIKDLTTGQTITIDEHFYSQSNNWGIEKIIFADATSWNLTEINSHAWIRGTNGNDTINGTNWNDVFKGGLGDDFYQSGAGSDTYVYSSGDGNDYINDESGSTTDVDTLRFIDLNAGDITLSRSGVHLKITDISTGKIITIDEHFYSQSANFGIEKIEFADGSAWDLSQINLNAWIRGGSGNDTITGTAWNDSLFGDSGNDTLSGAAGNDTFIFKSGFGLDTLTDFTAGAGSQDVIQLDQDVFADFASVLAAASQVGSDTLITYDAANVLTLKNVAMTSLHQDDFRFMSS